jgi:predicted N-acetyltransferase YhbS
MGVSSDYRIRVACPADAEAIFDLVRDLATSFSVEEPRFRKAFGELLLDHSTCIRVAAFQGIAVGYVLGFEHLTFFASGRVAWVEELMVAEGHRRKGVGESLMNAVTEWAVGRECRMIGLATRRAADFYSAIGYEASATYFRKMIGDPDPGNGQAINVGSRNTCSDFPDYAVILWDNDGVLVDTERWYFQATREVFAGVGIDLTSEHYFEYFLSRSKGTSRFGAAHGLGEADIAALQDDRNERYLQTLEQEAIAIAGVRQTLELLRPHFVMGIATTSRRQHFEMIHRRTGLLDLVDFAITHEDYPRSKPA